MNRAGKIVLALLNTLIGAFVAVGTTFGMAFSPGDAATENVILVALFVALLIGVVAGWTVALKRTTPVSIWWKILSFVPLAVVLFEGGLPLFLNLLLYPLSLL